MGRSIVRRWHGSFARSSTSTAFGRHSARAGPGGLLLEDAGRRHGRQGRPRAAPPQSELPPERIDDVVLAATAQVGDQGLTLGRDVALLAGLPRRSRASPSTACARARSRPRPPGRARSPWAPPTSSSSGGVEHMGHHPMGEDVDFNPRFVSERIVDDSAAVMGQTAENLHDALPQPDEGGRGRVRRRVPAKAAKAWDDGVMDEIVVPMSVFTRGGLDGRRARPVPAARHDARRSRDTPDALPRRPAA